MLIEDMGGYKLGKKKIIIISIKAKVCQKDSVLDHVFKRKNCLDALAIEIWNYRKMKIFIEFQKN